MTVLLIHGVQVKTKAGWPASIDGVDPSDDDFLVGTIHSPALGVVNAKWNSGGTCRNKSTDCNLDPHEPDIADVIRTAEGLRTLFP